ncbi:unnamed protein product [Trichobilharzia regenti]|nr:unnamed protein product [Trichobilharzia regenti]
MVSLISRVTEALNSSCLESKGFERKPFSEVIDVSSTSALPPASAAAAAVGEVNDTTATTTTTTTSNKAKISEENTVPTLYNYSPSTQEHYRNTFMPTSVPAAPIEPLFVQTDDDDNASIPVIKAATTVLQNFIRNDSQSILPFSMDVDSILQNENSDLATKMNSIARLFAFNSLAQLSEFGAHKQSSTPSFPSLINFPFSQLCDPSSIESSEFFCCCNLIIMIIIYLLCSVAWNSQHLLQYCI